jgi:hypothetical protein
MDKNTFIVPSKKVIEAEFVTELTSNIPGPPKVPVIVLEVNDNSIDYQFIVACIVCVAIGVVIGLILMFIINLM